MGRAGGRRRRRGRHAAGERRDRPHRIVRTRPIPPDTLPGGAYDRYVARLAAEGRFSGVVLLSHQGRTVLSRGYGMADEERGIRNHEGTAFSLSSAGNRSTRWPFCSWRSGAGCS